MKNKLLIQFIISAFVMIISGAIDKNSIAFKDNKSDSQKSLNSTFESVSTTNDTCDNASPAVINSDSFCEVLNFGTFDQATGSGIPSSCDDDPVVQDVWFEFTATTTTLKFLTYKLKNISKRTDNPKSFNVKS